MKDNADTNEVTLFPTIQPEQPLAVQNVRFMPTEWRLDHVRIKFQKGNSPEKMLNSVNFVLELKGKLVALPVKKVYLNGIEYTATDRTHNFPGAIMLFESKNQWHGLYLPEVGYNSLIIQLYLLQKPSLHFEQVYPPTAQPRFPPPKVKIWKITYPENLRARQEYLGKQFDDSELYNSWMFGK